MPSVEAAADFLAELLLRTGSKAEADAVIEHFFAECHRYEEHIPTIVFGRDALLACSAGAWLAAAQKMV